MLSRRGLSRAEISERLERRGFAASEVTREVTRLAGAGLVDDRSLARQICDEALKRGAGRRAIAATLRRRKIPRGVALEALEGLDDGEVAAALLHAYRRAVRRYAAWRVDRRERDKLIRFLLARGFDLGAAKRLLEGALDGEEGGDQPA